MNRFALRSLMPSFTRGATKFLLCFAEACLFVVAGCDLSQTDRHATGDDAGSAGSADSSVDAARDADRPPDALDATPAL